MKVNKKLVLQIGSLFGLTVLSGLAIASPTIGTVAGSLNGTMGTVADSIGSAMYLAAIGTGGMAAFKFKAHAEDPRQVKLTQPLIYLVSSGVLAGLPTVLNITSNTVAGGTANAKGVIGAPATGYGTAN